MEICPAHVCVCVCVYEREMLKEKEYISLCLFYI